MHEGVRKIFKQGDSKFYVGKKNCFFTQLRK